MKRNLLFILSVMVTILCYSQPKINLSPQNMIKYIGKVKKAEFEKIVGEPVSSVLFPNDAYHVINTFSNSLVILECTYNVSDSILVSVFYPSKTNNGYLDSFKRFRGFTKKKNLSYWEDPMGILKILTLTFEKFQCEITKEWNLNYAIKYSILK